MKYKKAVKDDPPWLLGMLYLIDVRVSVLSTREIMKHHMLVIGGEEADIERKLRWMFDVTKYTDIRITSCVRIREKMHILRTTLLKESTEPDAVIKRLNDVQNVFQPTQVASSENGKFWAVGLSTTMHGFDEGHCIRKIARALAEAYAPIKNKDAPVLSENSTLLIEEISEPSGFAMPRDVTGEANKAHIFRS